MNALENVNLSDRIAKLERQNRRLKQMGLLSLATAGIWLLCGAQTVNDTLEIREQLLVLDKKGSVRFDMGVNPNDGKSNGLVVIGLDRKPKIRLGINDRGDGYLEFYDSNGNTIRSFP